MVQSLKSNNCFDFLGGAYKLPSYTTFIQVNKTSVFNRVSMPQCDGLQYDKLLSTAIELSYKFLKHSR